jgi:hypothetical protein
MVSNTQNYRKRRDVSGDEGSEQLHIVKIGILVPLAEGQQEDRGLDTQVQAAIEAFRGQNHWIQTKEIRQEHPCLLSFYFKFCIMIYSLSILANSLTF